MRRFFQSIAVCGAALLGGCGSFVEPCDRFFETSFWIEVREFGSHFPAAHGAHGVATSAGGMPYPLAVIGWEGERVDSLALFMGAIAPPGRYDIRISKAGYQDWTANNQEVRDSRCGPVPLQLQATLRRTP